MAPTAVLKMMTIGTVQTKVSIDQILLTKRLYCLLWYVDIVEMELNVYALYLYPTGENWFEGSDNSKADPPTTAAQPTSGLDISAFVTMIRNSVVGNAASSR